MLVINKRPPGYMCWGQMVPQTSYFMPWWHGTHDILVPCTGHVCYSYLPLLTRKLLFVFLPHTVWKSAGERWTVFLLVEFPLCKQFGGSVSFVKIKQQLRKVKHSLSTSSGYFPPKVIKSTSLLIRSLYCELWLWQTKSPNKLPCLRQIWD